MISDLLLLLKNYWYLFLIFIIVIFLLGVVYQRFIHSHLKRFFNTIHQRLRSIKRYWIFVLIYTPLTVIGYASILNFSPTKATSLYIDVYGQVISLIFAIFVGFFAFLQVTENKLDKQVEQADEFIDEGNRQRAIHIYEACLRIDDTRFIVWSNLMEAYLIEGRFDAFAKNVEIFKTKVQYDEERVQYFVVLLTKPILEDNVGVARNKIKEIVDYVSSNPNALKFFRWRFTDVQTSSAFNNLSSTSQSMYKNVEKYLLGQLSASEKIRFQGGDYELTIQPAATPTLQTP